MPDPSEITEPGATHVVEVRTGDAAPESIYLHPGTPIEPMSIGRQGAWCIDAVGMLDVHAYVYWDGRQLYFQSADAKSPAKVNGKRVPAEWTAAECPATVSLGEARLVYCGVEEARVRRKPKAQTTSGSIIVDDGSDDEHTRVAMPRAVLPGAGGRGSEDDQATRMAMPRAPTPFRGGEDDQATRMAMPRADVPPPKVHDDDDEDEATRMTKRPLLGGGPAVGARGGQARAPVAPQTASRAPIPPRATPAATPAAKQPVSRAPQQPAAAPPPAATPPAHSYPELDDLDGEATGTLPLPLPPVARPADFQPAPAPPPPLSYAPPPAPVPSFAQASRAMQSGGFAPPPAGFTPPAGAPDPAPPPAPGGFVAPSMQSGGFAPVPVGGPLDVPPPPPPPVAPKASPLDEVKKQWAETSLPKKIILALLPIGFVMVIIAFNDEPAAPNAKAKTTASASASASASDDEGDKGKSKSKGKAKPKPADDDDDAPPTKKPTKAVTPPASASADTPTTAASTKPSAKPTSTAPAAGAPSAAPSTTTDGPKTPEREAADALAAKNWAEAAKLYDALAKEHPDDPGYATAARILKAKAKREKKAAEEKGKAGDE
jgi:hypothetical protein